MGAVRMPAPRDERVGLILHADAVDALSRMGQGTVGAIVHDPPFFIATQRPPSGAIRPVGMNSDPWADHVSSHRGATEFYLPVCQQAVRVLRPGGSVITMGGSQSISAWEDAAAQAGLCWMAEITVLWNTGKPRRRNFGSLTTTIRWHIKPGGRYAFETDAKSLYSNVLVCRKIPLDEREHPAQKPVELTNFLVSLLTTPDDLVVDPFCGSGSTLVSAVMCERSFIGIDKDEHNCEIASRRVQQIDSEDAKLRPIYFWINGRLEEVS